MQDRLAEDHGRARYPAARSFHPILADARLLARAIARRGAQQRWTNNEEPKVAEILSEPIVHLLMKRDRLTSADLERNLIEARRRLARR